MGVIVDTCVWVDVERGRLAPADIADLIGDEAVFIAAPVIAELEYGVHQAKTNDRRIKRARSVGRIKTKPCVIMDAHTGELFGKLAAQLCASGNAPQHRIQDLWLAALAVQYNMTLLTRNEKDFVDVPGLDLAVI